MREQTNKILKTLCIYMLVISMMLSSVAGSWQVMAAGIAKEPTITSAAAGSKEVKGGGLLGANRRKGQNITTTIYVTVKNGNTIIEEASTIIQPKNSARDGWTVTLQNALVAGQTVYVKQKCNDDISNEVSAEVKETLASKHKNALKMPSGDLYLEDTTAALVSKDEAKELLDMVKKANPTFANDIESAELKYAASATKGTIVVTYTDGSSSEKINADNLNLVQITEISRGYILDPYNVVSNKISGKLEGQGPFDNIKVQIIINVSGADSKNFKNGSGKACIPDKNSSHPIDLQVDKTTGQFSYTLQGSDNLEIGKILSISVKEPTKFMSCNIEVTEMAMPKITDVKDPKKIKPEEKEKIADAIRKANTTTSGKSKLPNGAGYERGGIPAYIEITDDGKVKVISPNNVDGSWDSTLNKFVPATNQDGTVKVSKGKESSTIELNDPKKLVKNVAPDAPKLENKGGNVTITPNIKVDTDAQTVEVEYEDPQGNTNKVTATKTATGWTVDNNKAKVDKNGVVTIPTKEIKNGSTVKAVVIDRDGLPATDPTTPSGKAELKIENKYKVTYDSNGGTGTMPEEEVNVGSKYRILENQFTPPAEKEFDKWMIGFEPKNPGEDTEVNNDIVIKAIWKYIINPTASEVETIVGHPVDYDMYKKAIKDFPADLKVEHIEVKEAPDISKVGGTQAEISVRFSDGQFRTIPVTVNVKPDPKDKEIEKLNNDIKGLNKQITDLNNKIAEKDGKITELNGKITELEKQLKACQEQCAADKAQCEKAKKALQEQINTLAKEKSNLEIQVKENRELIEQLRSQITDLKQQVEDWKKIAGEKDTKIKELENNIKELNTKLETANTANTELKEKLATANQKITDLEAKVKELEGKVTELEGKIKELGNTIKSKDAEIKTLNETIATLKEKVATLETEKTKDKEQYEKDKTALQEKLDKANADLTAKNAELDKIKAELEQAKKDLADEKAKTAGLTEKTKAQEEKIAGLEEQLKALQDKLNKADTDLKAANARILELEKQLTEKETENKALTEQVEKLGKDLETKTTEVNNLNSRIVELEKQVSEKTAQGVADKAEIERLKAELEELKGKLKTKSDEADKLSKEIVTL
ncbi:Rib/alpha-like domain-containing protein, partial [uncultured Peptoniphilus sp.]|uniref:Rib/alpha-like domain-containing protein n=1 Tax=uncultured Peptoniphilus sp. TaxID=254354 RepID=UPI0028055DC2